MAAALAGCTGASAPPAPWPGGASAPARNAVLIVVDTLRDDASRAASTPTLDRLSRDGARVARSWAGGTWTVPSVVSLLTGMHVRQHGWDLPTGQMGRYPPLPEAPSIASVLKGAGFHTTGHYTNPYLAEALGFDRGFDLWKRTVDRALPAQFAGMVAEQWTPEGRHFAYVHFIGPHSPLKPSPEAAQRWGVDPVWLEGGRGLMIGRAKRDREPGVRDAYTAAYHAVIEDTDARIAEVLEALGFYWVG